MESQFKKLLEKAKAQKEQKDPLFKTFEGALFEHSSWFFHFQEDLPLKNAESLSLQPAVLPEIKQDYLSQVVFVGDTFSEQSGGEDLLGKMIEAMKLSPQKVFRYKLNPALEDVTDLAGNREKPGQATLDLLAFISEKRPQVVVSLGAVVTNILLGRREKLSVIHGHFFDLAHENYLFTVMPLFHPDFLLINPNMKRTAWIDLQKVMERVGKN